MITTLAGLGMIGAAVLGTYSGDPFDASKPMLARFHDRFRGWTGTVVVVPARHYTGVRGYYGGVDVHVYESMGLTAGGRYFFPGGQAGYSTDDLEILGPYK